MIYRPEIDGLRALAVMAVILHHFDRNILPSGYLGVDLFFVISGYVITASLSHRKYSSIQNVFISFYSRRVKRLVPALIFCVVVTSFIIFLFNQVPGVSIKTGMSALFGVSNLYLFHQSTDYFGQSAELNFFTHTWSLGVEEQFYLVFPFILWFTGFLRRTQSGSARLLLVIGTLSVLSLVSYVYLSSRNPNLAYFLTPFRFWELGIGCLFFLLVQERSEINIPFHKLNSGFLLFLIIAVFFAPASVQVSATVAVVGLTALLIASLRTGTVTHRILTFRPIVYIGLLSYSLYLWHWSILTLSRWTIGIHWWSVPIQLGLIFLLAYISYTYIEKPFRHLRWSSHKFMDISYALFFSLLVTVVVFIPSHHYSNSLYLGNANTLPFGNSDSSVIARSSSDPAFLSALSIAERNLIDCNMTPHHLSGDSYRPAPLVNETFIDNCLSTPNRKIILVGDSFAGVVGKHIAHAAWTLGYDFSSITGYGCPYPLDIKNIFARSKSYCEIESSIIKHSIEKNMSSGDILVLRLYFPKTEYIELSEQTLISDYSTYDEEISSLTEIAQSKGASVLIIGSNATAILPTGCDRQEWFNYPKMTNKECGFVNMNLAVVNRFSIGHNQYLSRVSNSGNMSFSFVDPMAYICSDDQKTCPVFNSEMYFMFDQYHLSMAAIDKFYPPLFSELKRLSRVDSP